MEFQFQLSILSIIEFLSNILLLRKHWGDGPEFGIHSNYVLHKLSKTLLVVILSLNSKFDYCREGCSTSGCNATRHSLEWMYACSWDIWNVFGLKPKSIAIPYAVWYLCGLASSLKSRLDGTGYQLSSEDTGGSIFLHFFIIFDIFMSHHRWLDSDLISSLRRLSNFCTFQRSQTFQEWQIV